MIKLKLKDPDVLKKKPNLKLYYNHYIEEAPEPIRVWDSAKLGQAVRFKLWYEIGDPYNSNVYWKDRILNKIERLYDSDPSPIRRARLLRRYNSLCNRLQYFRDI